MSALRAGSTGQVSPSSAAALGRLLRAASLLLALLFVLQVLVSLPPLASGPLPLALSLGNALITLAPIPVLATCLVALAECIDERSRLGRRLARFTRLLALPVAIGYLLLIPLYGSALWSRSHAEARALEQNLKGSLVRLEQARSRVLQASSASELNRILEALPIDSPPLSRFGADLPSRRIALVDFFDQVRRILTQRRQGVQQQLLGRFVRDLGLFSLACLGLAVLFQRCSCISLPLRRAGSRRAQPAPHPRSARAQLDHDMGMLLAQRSPQAQPTSPGNPAQPQPADGAASTRAPTNPLAAATALDPGSAAAAKSQASGVPLHPEPGH